MILYPNKNLISNLNEAFYSFLVRDIIIARAMHVDGCVTEKRKTSHITMAVAGNRNNRPL